MDATMQTISEELVNALHDAGLMDSTIKQYRQLLKYLEVETKDGMYTKEAARAFLGKTHNSGVPFNSKYQQSRKRLILLIEGFLETGEFDLSLKSNRLPQPLPTSEALLGSLRAYSSYMDEQGFAKATCDYYWRMAREYLLLLEDENYSSIEQADASSVFLFVSSLRKRWSNTSTYSIASNFRPFLKFLKRDDLVDALKMTNPKRKHDIVNVLNKAEEEAIAQVCCNRLVPVRDAAITLLALTTGMRACDIISLKITDIDWRTASISIIQRKTGNPLRLPMVPALEELLAEYLLDVRPKCASDYVFLRSKAPHSPLTDHSAIYIITHKTMLAAGVNKAGTRLLRHNAATGMLRAEVELPTISAVLGYADPNSANSYLELDVEPMRHCVLPLPKGVA